MRDRLGGTQKLSWGEDGEGESAIFPPKRGPPFFPVCGMCAVRGLVGSLRTLLTRPATSLTAASQLGARAPCCQQAQGVHGRASAQAAADGGREAVRCTGEQKTKTLGLG
ncbi:unnamed protein product [Prorocentrum cordatum]|uniref:Uncharacterized protein n=1 Tax=Prorocentrum cordatum TaxID=2364126 RepID=A0ABN9Q188_9DINO|nr:unnamed protein product [Polarella glacialis]